MCGQSAFRLYSLMATKCADVNFYKKKTASKRHLSLHQRKLRVAKYTVKYITSVSLNCVNY